MVSPDHPLAGKSSVSLEELTAYNAILSGSATFTRQIAAQQFSHPELRLKTAMSTNYLDTIRMMVTIGLGWSLLPDTMINKDLSVLNVDAPPVSRQLGYISHKERTLSKAAQRFIEMLEANSGT
ncbi:LysR family transcriptional regulator substrate-binding protein [Aliamphritea spongicola]|nr:LysR family transcriptional regulator substrate-binding protein [Aliamphritea spongicola]